ncbi:MAG: transglutaminase domain-containing protein [Solirubrobacterales bacterium]|nr:transglutaminase domain-containing protein [Solirubrobacterales bacterium]
MSALQRASGSAPPALTGARTLPHSGLRSVPTADRPAVRLITFAALALYGVLRWATLTKPAPGMRLAGMLVLAVAIAALGTFALPALTERAWYEGWNRVSWMARGWWRRALVAFFCLLSLCAMLALAGIPVAWLYGVRVAVIARGVQEGLSSFPGLLLPYLGVNPWVRIVMSLGAGLLLLCAALTICTRSPSEARRAAAALQLAALAVIPARVMHPQFPYLQGLLLFALVAAFMWGERVVSRRSGGAIAVIGLAAVLATALAPAFGGHRPWLNYRSLAGPFSPGHVETFDWTQRYGPYNWPRDDRTVMTVKARHPDYWKAENLDVFDGFGWSQGSGPITASPSAPTPQAVRRWSQTITVTMQAMRTTAVIAAGYSRRPAHVDAVVLPGESSGTWTASAPLAPGASYTVSTYSPRPSPAQLQAIPARAYPDAPLADYRVVDLPSQSAAYGKPQVELPPFHSSGLVLNLAEPYGPIGGQLLRQSPYARAYALAGSLAASAPTPYAFVTAVQQYLSPANGFSYDEHTASHRYPLMSFLFGDRRGYCQQFAGAMALLLRLGGIPARVSTGFTTGFYNPPTRTYLVSDRNAHAWVEAWFPHYGWVRFNPTPPSAPAIADQGSPLSVRAGQGHSATHVTARRNASTGGAAGRRRAALRSGAAGLWLILLPALGLALLATAAAVWLRGGRHTPEQLIGELERALARCGRPAGDGVTLRALEHRFRQSPAAAGYLRRLRLARYGVDGELPTGTERRALRAQLAAGLGPTGWIRAWWALPPRRRAHRERAT